MHGTALHCATLRFKFHKNVLIKTDVQRKPNISIQTGRFSAPAAASDCTRPVWNIVSKAGPRRSPHRARLQQKDIKEKLIRQELGLFFSYGYFVKLERAGVVRADLNKRLWE